MPDVISTDARDLFSHYLLSPGEYWGEPKGGAYQITKLLRGLTAICEREQLSKVEAIGYVLDLARRRADGHPPTVYIGGRGGSGSHWLAEMLDDLGPYANAGEVGYPTAVRRTMRRFPRAQQALVIDAIHLVHALGNRADAADLSLVNCRGMVNYLPVKQWEPGSVFVHLIRDPRDQCLSVTYRKPDARQLYPVDGGDDEFLRLHVFLYRVSLLRVLSYPVPPDYVVRYEDLRLDAGRVLVEFCASMGHSIPDERVTAVAYTHQAENVNAGLAPRKTNLSRGERRGWRESTSPRERQVFHAGLSDILDLTRYPLDDCLGSRLAPLPLTEDVVAELPEGVILGELHSRPADADVWQPLGPAAGSVRLPAGHEVRLRCPGGWTSPLTHIDALPAGALSAVCLAANQDVTDEDLVHLRSQTGLRELDLARTQITDLGLRHLTGLTELRGLSLLGSRVTADAAAEFARQHPECDVAGGELWSERWREGNWLDDEYLP